jgi:hypothetical protein
MVPTKTKFHKRGSSKSIRQLLTEVSSRAEGTGLEHQKNVAIGKRVTRVKKHLMKLILCNQGTLVGL